MSAFPVWVCSAPDKPLPHLFSVPKSKLMLYWDSLESGIGSDLTISGNAKMPKRVFVSGCFDMLHSGHVAFLQTAASYGDLYVALGSDATVYGLKGRLPVNT